MTQVKHRLAFILSGCVMFVSLAARPIPQELPKGITAEDHLTSLRTSTILREWSR
jgi:hypothetical protein